VCSSNRPPRCCRHFVRPPLQLALDERERRALRALRYALQDDARRAVRIDEGLPRHIHETGKTIKLAERVAQEFGVLEVAVVCLRCEPEVDNSARPLRRLLPLRVDVDGLQSEQLDGRRVELHVLVLLEELAVAGLYAALAGVLAMCALVEVLRRVDRENLEGDADLLLRQEWEVTLDHQNGGAVGGGDIVHENLRWLGVVMERNYLANILYHKIANYASPLPTNGQIHPR